MEKSKFLETFKSYAIITLGLVFYVLAWVVFIMPHQLVGGGVTGMGYGVYLMTKSIVGGIEVSF